MQDWGYIKKLPGLPGSFSHILELWGTLSRTFDSSGWFRGSSDFFVEQLKPIEYTHFRGTQNPCSSLNPKILSQSCRINKGSTDDKVLVGDIGFEPMTFATSMRRSSQLS